MNKLLDAGAACAGYDPKASDDELAEARAGMGKDFTRATSVRELASGADALVLVTEWPQFRDLPFASLAKLMNRPLLVDSKNFLDPALVAAAGIDYQGFGRAIAQPTSAGGAGR
jgi:UDPglucose 6-dehydrogenase